MMLGPSLAGAHNYKAGDISIEHPWSRATPPGAFTAVGFLTLKNVGAETDYLLSAQSGIADHVEVHSMKMQDGVMKMRPVGPTGLPIPAGKSVKLAPGGFHMMFIGLKKTLQQGQTIPVTLQFKNAGPVMVDFVVEALGAKGPGGMKDMKMNHKSGQE